MKKGLKCCQDRHWEKKTVQSSHPIYFPKVLNHKSRSPSSKAVRLAAPQSWEELRMLCCVHQHRHCHLYFRLHNLLWTCKHILLCIFHLVEWNILTKTWWKAKHDNHHLAKQPILQTAPSCLVQVAAFLRTPVGSPAGHYWWYLHPSQVGVC